MKQVIFESNQIRQQEETDHRRDRAQDHVAVVDHHHIREEEVAEAVVVEQDVVVENVPHQVIVQYVHDQ